MGPFFNPDLVVAVTTGLLNPHTHLPFDIDFKNENDFNNDNETYRDAANDNYDDNDNFNNYYNNGDNCNKDNNINNIRLINVKREESEGDGEKCESRERDRGRERGRELAENKTRYFRSSEQSIDRKSVV